MKSKTKYDLNYNIALLFSETASEVENVLITLCHLYTCFYLGFLGQLGFAAHAFLVCH